MSQIQKTLKELKDKKTNVSLHDHLKEVLAKLVLQNPKNAFQLFEQYSFHLKGSKEEEVVYKVKQSFNHLKDYQQKNRILLNKINVGTQQEPQQPASIGYVPNIIEEGKIFQKVGVGFGEDQTYRIYKSITKLAAKKTAKQVRFWGKILTSGQDYFIAQGVADGGEQSGQLPPDVEAKGTGVNKLNYWAINQLSGQWVQLPLVTPQQIRVSRKIKYLFTGNLNAKIITNPHFVGKQSHLLKCQILRITASSTIVPKGLYVPNAEDPKQIDLAQQFKYPDPRTLSKLQNWVHHPVAILKIGRLTHTKPQGLQPQEQQKAIKQLERRDPYQPRLKLLTQDKGTYTWKIGAVDLQNQYKSLSKDGKVINYGIAYIKSLIWPGWLTTSYLGKTSSIYVGYGFKASQTYYPNEPEKILEEQVDRLQINQPN